MAAVKTPLSAQEIGFFPMPTMMGTGAVYDRASLQQRTPPQQAGHHSPLYQNPSPPRPQHPRDEQDIPQNAAETPGYSQLQTIQQQAAHARSVKRPRPVKSCTECRKRKLRCDRLCPCSQCQKSSRSCKYAADHDSSNLSETSDNEVVDNNNSSRPTKRNCLPGSTGSLGTNHGEPSHAPNKTAEGGGNSVVDELLARMVQLEKQIHIRDPGLFEENSRDKIGAAPDTIRGLSVKQNGTGTRFFGQNSARVLLNLFDDAKDFLSDHARIAGSREVLSNFKKLHEIFKDNYARSLRPITVFVDSMMPVQKRLRDILPHKSVCDKLLQSYFDTSETIYRMVHIPTLKRHYAMFWEGQQLPEHFLPQIISVLAIGSRFDTKSKGLNGERSEGVHIPTACALVRTWLDGLRGKQLIELSTLEVEILLLHAQRMVTPRAEDSWTQLGFVIRLAMTMGLHRDPSEFEPRVTPYLGEIRRRLWYTILDMDLHLSLSTNLPCLVRDGDFTCRPPRNLDDDELYPDMKELPPTKPIDQLADNQMQVYAAMTLGIRMKVAHLVNRMDTIRDYQEVLDVGQKLDRFLEDINYIFPRHGILSEAQKSKQWRSRVILDMHVRRPLLALYRPFAIGASNAPPQIARAYLRSSLVILKYLDELDPRMAHYQDISEMYHLVLKKEIIQAAISVCFYIRSALRPDSMTHVIGYQALRMSPDTMEEGLVYQPDNPTLWSPARLIQTVEKTLDLLVDQVGSSDIKDIICLATILETVKSADPQGEDVVEGLRHVLDGCLKVSKMSIESLAVPSPRQSFSADPVTETYMRGQIPYMYSGNSVAMSASLSSFEGWTIWDGWD